MFCNNCGREHDNRYFCSWCGMPVKEEKKIGKEGKREKEIVKESYEKDIRRTVTAAAILMFISMAFIFSKMTGKMEVDVEESECEKSTEEVLVSVNTELKELIFPIFTVNYENEINVIGGNGKEIKEKSIITAPDGTKVRFESDVYSGKTSIVTDNPYYGINVSKIDKYINMEKIVFSSNGKYFAFTDRYFVEHRLVEEVYLYENSGKLVNQMYFEYEGIEKYLAGRGKVLNISDEGVVMYSFDKCLSYIHTDKTVIAEETDINYQHFLQGEEFNVFAGNEKMHIKNKEGVIEYEKGIKSAPVLFGDDTVIVLDENSNILRVKDGVESIIFHNVNKIYAFEGFDGIVFERDDGMYVYDSRYGVMFAASDYIKGKYALTDQYVVYLDSKRNLVLYEFETRNEEVLATEIRDFY